MLVQAQCEGLGGTGGSMYEDIISQGFICSQSGWWHAQELLLKLVEDYYPLPADPYAIPEAAQKGAKGKNGGTERQVGSKNVAKGPAEGY